MDCKKVQYPSFKMALIFPKNKNFADDTLNYSLKQACECLSKTKFADVEINDVDNELSYTIKYLYPRINDKGKLFYKQFTGKNFVTLNEAVDTALRVEKCLSLLNEYKKRKVETKTE